MGQGASISRCFACGSATAIKEPAARRDDETRSIAASSTPPPPSKDCNGRLVLPPSSSLREDDRRVIIACRLNWQVAGKAYPLQVDENVIYIPMPPVPQSVGGSAGHPHGGAAQQQIGAVGPAGITGITLRVTQVVVHGGKPVVYGGAGSAMVAPAPQPSAASTTDPAVLRARVRQLRAVLLQDTGTGGDNVLLDTLDAAMALRLGIRAPPAALLLTGPAPTSSAPDTVAPPFHLPVEGQRTRNGDMRVSATWMLDSEDRAEGLCLFPTLLFDLLQDKTFPLSIPMDTTTMDAVPSPLLPYSPANTFAGTSVTLSSSSTMAARIILSPVGDSMQPSKDTAALPAAGVTTMVMMQRLLPILANLPCAVTLLDLDSGPVYQNGPSLSYFGNHSDASGSHYHPSFTSGYALLEVLLQSEVKDQLLEHFIQGRAFKMMVQVPSSCRLDDCEPCISLPTAAMTTAAIVPACQNADYDEQQAAAAAAALLASGTNGGTGRRRSTCARASFAVWADSAPADSSALTLAGSSSGPPPAGTEAVLYPPRASMPGKDHGAADPRVGPENDNGGGSNVHPFQARPASEGADLSKCSAVYRRSSAEEMFACGLVIQPSPKLLGLMQIHDRGSTSAAGSFTARAAGGPGSGGVRGSGSAGEGVGVPNRLMKSRSSGVAAAAGEPRRPAEPTGSASRRGSDNGSWEFSMLNGALRVGSGGAALQPDSLSGEFAGLMMSRTGSGGSGAVRNNSSSVGLHRSGGSGSKGSTEIVAEGRGSAPRGLSNPGQAAGQSCGGHEGCDEGEEEEEEAAAWHSLEATPLTDAVTGKKMLLLVQTNVSARVDHEVRMTLMNEAQMGMLEQMFPRHILEHMMAAAEQEPGGGPASVDHLAHSHQNVTIMFMDIVGFTTMSKGVLPTEVMAYLNALFTLFDELIDQYGVYKVETAGDCYIVAGALMQKDEDGFLSIEKGVDAGGKGAEKVMAFAKAILRCSKTVSMPHDGSCTQVRVGMHTGPVVTGLIGTKLPKFSVFGDTMNTASRMESTGVPGCIQVSEATRNLLTLRHTFQDRGGLEVKGKEAAALLKQVARFTKTVLDPSSIEAIFRAAPGSSSSGSRSSGPIGNMLMAALSSLPPGGSGMEATMPVAVGGIIPLQAAAGALVYQLVQCITRTSSSSTNLTASQLGSVVAEAAAAGAGLFPRIPSSPSLMELLHEALGSNPGNAEEARPGGGGARILGAPRAGVPAPAVPPGSAGASVSGFRTGSISRAGSSLSVGEGRIVGSRAERWQAALLTSATASRKSRDAEVEAERRRMKDAAQGRGDSRAQSAENVMFSTEGLLHLAEADPVCGVEGWDEGETMHPGFSGSLKWHLPTASLKDAPHHSGGGTEGGSMALGDSTAAGGRTAAGGSSVAGGGTAVGGSTAAPSSDLPKSIKAGSATHLASGSIAVLAAQAQAAHLVGLLANNQQLLSGSWAQRDASVHSSSLTVGSGGQRSAAGSDTNLSRMSDALSTMTPRPTGSSSSQRDNASRRLSALLMGMRADEAEGLHNSSDAMRQRWRSALGSTAAGVGGSAPRLIGPPPTPDELAEASLTLGIDISGDAPLRPKAPRRENTFKVERRPFRPFCQPSSSGGGGGGPLCHVPAPENEDEQSIAEEASD